MRFTGFEQFFDKISYTSVGSSTLSCPIVPALATKGAAAKTDAEAAAMNSFLPICAFSAVDWGPWVEGANAAAPATRVARIESFMFDLTGRR